MDTASLLYIAGVLIAFSIFAMTLVWVSRR